MRRNIIALLLFICAAPVAYAQMRPCMERQELCDLAAANVQRRAMREAQRLQCEADKALNPTLVPHCPNKAPAPPEK